MIFLSHSWSAKPMARRIVEALSGVGAPVWIDEQQLEPSAELRAALRKAIADSGVYLYLVSDAANASKWCQDELSFALGLELDAKLRVVPVRMAGEDSTPLPPVLHGRLYTSLDNSKGGGVARLASELQQLETAMAPSPDWRASATVRYAAPHLEHTLEMSRAFNGLGDGVRVLFVDEDYNRVDERYWRVSEVQLPSIGDDPRRVEEAQRLVRGIHDQCRRAISALPKLAARNLAVRPGGPDLGYHTAATEEAFRQLLHRLAWNVEYLALLRDRCSFDQEFVNRRDRHEPFDAHRCDFVLGGEKFGVSRVPEHGHPYAGELPSASWGLTSPFSDMTREEVGRAVGFILARRLLAGTSTRDEVPDPTRLLYGLS